MNLLEYFCNSILSIIDELQNESTELLNQYGGF